MPKKGKDKSKTHTSAHANLQVGVSSLPVTPAKNFSRKWSNMHQVHAACRHRGILQRAHKEFFGKCCRHLVGQHLALVLQPRTGLRDRVSAAPLARSDK